MYVTERAVFRRVHDGLELLEVAPGIDLERDVFAHMDFRPKVAAHLKEMDPRLFRPERMSLSMDLAARPPQRRSARLELIDAETGTPSGRSPR
jgi:propionate CoA-transferase